MPLKTKQAKPAPTALATQVPENDGSMMLNRIRYLQPELRKSERKVAAEILAHPTMVVSSTIADLARHAGVSEPTVIRFCRTAGCTGFSDFKMRLAQSLASGVPYVHRDVNPDEPTAELSVKIFDRAIATLIETRNVLSFDAIGRALDILTAAARIDFYGLGSSGIVAADAQHKFLPLGVPTVAYADPHLQSASATTLKAGDAVIAISHTGSSRDMIENVRIALDSGADVIAITKGGSPLAKMTTVSLAVNVGEDQDIYIPMAARLAFLVIIDLLAVGVALRRGPAVIQRLEKLKQRLREKRVRPEIN